MTGLLLAVLAASLLGSAHCAGMCGPLMLLATDVVPIGPVARPPRWTYHASRGAAYLTLGALAGSFGAALDVAAARVGFRIAGILAAAAVAFFGVLALLNVVGVTRSHAQAPAFLRRLQTELATLIAKRPARQRAFGMGLLSALLPCGWLYAFVAVAAGTGSPLQGAGVMASFWAGTLPALVLVGFGARRFALRWPGLRISAAALVTVVGLLTASSRLNAEFVLRKTPADKCAAADDALAHAVKERHACCR